MTKTLNQLGENTSVDTDDLALVRDTSTGDDKKISMLNLFKGNSYSEMGQGAIVETIENSDGTAIRWESGLQLSWRGAEVDMTNTNVFSEPFPAGFVTGGALTWYTSGNESQSASDDQHAALYGGFDYESALRGQSWGSASWSFNRAEDPQAPTDCPVTLFAIGFWK